MKKELIQHPTMKRYLRFQVNGETEKMFFEMYGSYVSTTKLKISANKFLEILVQDAHKSGKY